MADDPMDGDRISIALVEDDVGFRDSLRSLIESKEGFSFAGGFGSAEEALNAMTEPAPKVLLLDVRLPGEPGSRSVRRFVDRFPGLVVIMLTVSDDDDDVFEALCNGAAGYLLKRTPPARLLESVRDAREGGAPMSPEIAKKVLAAFRRSSGRPSLPRDLLTSQERKFVSLLSQGYSYQAAAEELDVSVN